MGAGPRWWRPGCSPRCPCCPAAALPPPAARGLQALAAIELALAQAGAEWRLEVRDTRSRPAEALRLFQELADAGVGVVLGPLSTDEAVAVSGLARARSVPLLSLGALGAVAADDDPWAFRMAFRDADAARGLAAYARYTLELDLSLWITKVRALVAAWGTTAYHRDRVLAALVAEREQRTEVAG